MPLKFFALILPISLLSFWGEPAPASTTNDVTKVITVTKASKQGWLGVSIQDMTKELARSMDSKIEEGALVNEVVKHSPADSAGIKEGDIIVEFNGKTIREAEDLVQAVSKAKPGTKANVVVIRKGEKKVFQVTVGKNPRMCESYSISVPPAPCIEVFVGGSLYGLDLMELNKQLGEYFQAPNGEGVLVEKVEKGSTAEKAGFKAGDVIIKVGSKNVTKVRDIWRALKKYDEGEKVEIEIIRKGTYMTLTLEIEERPCFPMFNFWFGCKPPIRQFKHFHFDGFWPHLDELQYEIRSHLKPELDRLRIEIERLGEEHQRHMRELGDKLKKHIRYECLED